MALYRAAIPPKVADRIAGLPPGVKRAVKAAIRTLTDDPYGGEPLQGELTGRSKYRVRRYRIVYEVDKAARTLKIVAVGHRRTIYEDLTDELRNEK